MSADQYDLRGAGEEVQHSQKLGKLDELIFHNDAVAMGIEDASPSPLTPECYRGATGQGILWNYIRR